MEHLHLTSFDGTALAAYRWRPEQEAKGNVLLIHGFADHIARFTHVAEALTTAGYIVTGIELRGHGHSGGRRGYIDRWEDYLADVHTAAKTIEGTYVLLGHSMGGLVALDYLRHANRATGIIISAPLLGVAVEAPRWKTTLGKLLSNVWPTLQMGNEIDSTLVCTDARVVAQYEEDPLVFKTVTPRWYTELLETMTRVKGHAKHYTTPLLCVFGSEDRVVQTSAIHDFMKQYGGAKEHQVWENMYHELFNEPVQQEVFNRMTQWLDATPSTLPS